jgi:hypothetical protein
MKKGQHAGALRVRNGERDASEKNIVLIVPLVACQ